MTSWVEGGAEVAEVAEVVEGGAKGGGDGDGGGGGGGGDGTGGGGDKGGGGATKLDAGPERVMSNWQTTPLTVPPATLCVVDPFTTLSLLLAATVSSTSNFFFPHLVAHPLPQQSSADWKRCLFVANVCEYVPSDQNRSTETSEQHSAVLQNQTLDAICTFDPITIL